MYIDNVYMYIDNVYMYIDNVYMYIEKNYNSRIAQNGTIVFRHWNS
jgi:hypothetical protein